MLFDGVKVFSATKQQDRERLGETASAWMEDVREKLEVVDRDVVQSSDNAYHCLSIILYYRERGAA